MSYFFGMLIVLFVLFFYDRSSGTTIQEMGSVVGKTEFRQYDGLFRSHRAYSVKIELSSGRNLQVCPGEDDSSGFYDLAQVGDKVTVTYTVARLTKSMYNISHRLLPTTS